jgi:ankyrin repeat protein
MAVFQSALHSATIGGDIEIMKILLRRSVDVDILDTMDRTALHITMCTDSDMKQMETLLQAGANVNIQDGDGKTVLCEFLDWSHEAAYEESVVKLLLDYGVDIHAYDSHGMSALDYAAQHSKPSTFELLSNVYIESDGRESVDDLGVPYKWHRTQARRAMYMYCAQQ